MGYEVYVEHPESAQRRGKDFAAWSLWAPQNAPWTGVSLSDQAALLQAICEQVMDDSAKAACFVLDVGGVLQPAEVSTVWQLAGSAMSDKVREVFHFALEHRYPVRVVFSKGFGATLASAYLAKQLST